MSRSFKRFLFKLIRPLFVTNIDPNEEFECVICGEPVLKRKLVCSNLCLILLLEDEDGLNEMNTYNFGDGI